MDQTQLALFEEQRRRMVEARLEETRLERMLVLSGTAILNAFRSTRFSENKAEIYPSLLRPVSVRGIELNVWTWKYEVPGIYILWFEAAFNIMGELETVQIVAQEEYLKHISPEYRTGFFVGQRLY
jgi:hypothetical protein